MSNFSNLKVENQYLLLFYINQYKMEELFEFDNNIVNYPPPPQQSLGESWSLIHQRMRERLQHVSHTSSSTKTKLYQPSPRFNPHKLTLKSKHQHEDLIRITKVKHELKLDDQTRKKLKFQMLQLNTTIHQKTYASGMKKGSSKDKKDCRQIVADKSKDKIQRGIVGECIADKQVPLKDEQMKVLQSDKKNMKSSALPCIKKILLQQRTLNRANRVNSEGDKVRELKKTPYKVNIILREQHNFFQLKYSHVNTSSLSREKTIHSYSHSGSKERHLYGASLNLLAGHYAKVRSRHSPAGKQNNFNDKKNRDSPYSKNMFKGGQSRRNIFQQCLKKGSINKNRKPLVLNQCKDEYRGRLPSYTKV